ncbi:unnamed protein product, partial [Rotaria magnacalcarata]
VQLSDTYNQVRDNQLSTPVNIIAHPDATPLIRNIRPHVMNSNSVANPYDMTLIQPMTHVK